MTTEYDVKQAFLKRSIENPASKKDIAKELKIPLTKSKLNMIYSRARELHGSGYLERVMIGKMYHYYNPTFPEVPEIPYVNRNKGSKRYYKKQENKEGNPKWGIKLSDDGFLEFVTLNGYQIEFYEDEGIQITDPRGSVSTYTR